MPERRTERDRQDTQPGVHDGVDDRSARVRRRNGLADADRQLAVSVQRRPAKARYQPAHDQCDQPPQRRSNGDTVEAALGADQALRL